MGCQTTLVTAAPPDAEAREFFEKKVRPVLVEHCYKCHSGEAKKPKGGLRVDSRAALLKGGDGGPVLVPGNPGKSRLIEAVGYQNVDLLMPPKGKLPEAARADLTRWVQLGAPWPEEAPRPEKSSGNADTFDLAKRKQEHWAWHPVRKVTPPAVARRDWPRDPVDAFILARLEQHGLTPAGPADPRTLLRRVTFDLTGLPPTPGEVEAFLRDPSAGAYARAVERLLASPHFGERWGRHWLDLVRYAESRGHEFDPNIPNAHEYRDYVIRALNADVPYDQFVTEHLAGDLVPAPRLHPRDGFNESILGTGFWFLGEEVHSPVDTRQDQADRFDNRIDVMTKTFLGLTVACARCHDHKFDAISSRDYYALFGLLESSSYRLVRFDSLEQNRRVAAALTELRERTRPALQKALAEALRSAPVRPVEAPPAQAGPKKSPGAVETVVDYARCRPGEWLPDDVTFGPGPVRAGELRVEGDGARPLLRVAERGAAEFDRTWDGLRLDPRSENDNGALGKAVRPGRTLRTPSFTLTTGKVYYLVRGAALAYAAVDKHVLIQGPLHGALVTSIPAGPDFRWVFHDLTPYRGHRAHVEFTAAEGSDFAVARVVQADDQPDPESPEKVDLPEADRIQEVYRLLTEDKLLGHPQAAGHARWLNRVLQQAEVLRPDGPVGKVLQTYSAERKRLMQGIRWESRLAVALLDGNGVEERVFIRGSPKVLGDAVPRRFLEALGGTEPLTHRPGSGRLELARVMTDPAKNPLIGRVLVNRVWHHLFGRGLVVSTDNLGALGEAPTHPELLDYLAERLVQDGWSVKRLIRALVLSQTYRMSSQGTSPLSPVLGEEGPGVRGSSPKGPLTPTPRPRGGGEGQTAIQADPQNLLLHQARVRRLEGEAVRDALLVVSGRLDRRAFGPPVPVYLTEFLEGRGRPKGSGPLDGDGRRSIYVAVRRNFLPPMMLAFDTPSPFSTVGRRTVSNVPAQALILLNDPFVHQQAEVWGRRVQAQPGSVAGRVTGMYLGAYGRPPDADELAACLEFLERQGATAWTDLAHVLFNAKEFIYLK